jgi:predicted DNA-binding protein with PD1-like motif/glutaredoxin
MAPWTRRADGPRLLTSEPLIWRSSFSRSRAVQLQALHSVPLHLGAGSDIRRSLERLAVDLNASGFVLGVVGNLSQAAFQCPGQSRPTILEGDLEIITLQGTISPQGVHLHLSFSDGSCQVWGGHLEPGTLVQKGADLLVGLLEAGGGSSEGPSLHTSPRQADRLHPTEVAITMALQQPVLQEPEPARAPAGVSGGQAAPATSEPRVDIAVLAGCPYCARALRMLRTLGIAYRVVPPSGAGSLPQVHIDGVAIGGYDALAELHGRGSLEALRRG